MVHLLSLIDIRGLKVTRNLHAFRFTSLRLSVNSRRVVAMHSLLTESDRTGTMFPEVFAYDYIYTVCNWDDFLGV